MSPFIRLTFDGGRFVGHAAPVEVLAELVLVQRIVHVVARQLFLEENVTRARVPRGFRAATQLYVSSTKHNCFSIELIRAEGADFATWTGSSEDHSVFDRARDSTLAALLAVREGDQLPTDFPSEAAALLGGLGGRLRSDESLVIYGRTMSATVDEASRRQLAQRGLPVEWETTLEGEIEKVDDTADRFTMRVRDSDTEYRVEVPFERTRRTDVFEAAKRRPITIASVDGKVRVAGSVRKFVSVEQLDFIEHERGPEIRSLWQRLDHLGTLPPDWLRPGVGEPMSEFVLQRARDLLSRLLITNAKLPRPKVYPTPEGALQAEWDLENWTAEVVFRGSGSVEAEASHKRTSEDRDSVFGVGDLGPDNVGALSAWLETLT